MYYNVDWRQCCGPGMYMPPGTPGYPGQSTPSYPGGAPAGFPYSGGLQPMAQFILRQVDPLVHYFIREQIVEGGTPLHAVREVAAIAYLMGRGYPLPQAHRIVESWELPGEKFPGFD